MHPEAAYWALLTGEQQPAGRTLADFLQAWHAAGNRSVRDLFELYPEALPAALGQLGETAPTLLALRARLPQATRLMERLEAAGLDMVVWWERRYPRAVRARMEGSPPPVLWLAGAPALAGHPSVAVLGARNAPAEALAFARAVATTSAARGRTVLSGAARPLERATLEAALAAEGGTVIAVLGQGIARALPDLRKLQPRIQEGRLLVISPLHPEAAWQPSLDLERDTLAMALAERVVIAQADPEGSTWETAQQALRRGYPLFVRESDEEAHRRLLEQGARPLPWPAESPEALADALFGSATDRAPTAAQAGDGQAGVPAAAGQPSAAGSHRRRAASGPAAAVSARLPASEDLSCLRPPVPGPAPEGDLAGAVLRYLRSRRRTVLSKGRLLQATGAGEADLDQALRGLIAGGQIVERRHRTGAGYSLSQLDDPPGQGGTFQPSLFGQQD